MKRRTYGSEMICSVPSLREATNTRPEPGSTATWTPTGTTQRP